MKKCIREFAAVKTENDYASNLGATRTGGFGSTGN